MDNSILRETRKISIQNINKNYITKEEVSKYIKSAKEVPSVIVKKKAKSPRNRAAERSLRNRTIHTDDIIFDEWYMENKYDIDLVFGTLIGIYTSKKVVFFKSHNELYSLFVKKYYSKIRK